MTIFRLYKEMSIKISNWNIAVLLYSKENQLYILVSSVQSLTRVWLWSMVSSKPGFPVHQQLPELPQTHVHRVTDAMQPSSSVVPFSHLQFFPSSGSCSVSLFFASGGQSTGVSASTSVLPMNIQDWFPLELTSLFSLKSRGLSSVPPTPQFKNINSLALSCLHAPTRTSIDDYWKNHSFD